MKTIITIGRQHGSAGHEIGKAIAKQLSIPFYDRELLERASKESGICEELMENHDEKPTQSFLYSLAMGVFSYGHHHGNMIYDMPLNQRIFLAQVDAIRKIAAEGPCVIIGRCADYALSDNKNCLSVFIRADLDTRIRRVSELYKLSPDKAKERIQKIDKGRNSYYNFFSSRKWGDLENYDLCLNSGVLGINGTVEVILKAAEFRSLPNKDKLSIDTILP